MNKLSFYRGIPSGFPLALAAIMLFGCSKTGSGGSTGNNNGSGGTGSSSTPTVSLAAQLAGTFSGTGKKILQNINLGKFSGCVAPTGWENNLKTGASGLNISASGDSSVHLVFSGGPFLASDSYTLPISKSGNSIILSPKFVEPGVALNYDINAKSLTVSVNTASTYYVPANSCTLGLPYYFGEQSVPFDGTYVYLSIGHIEYAGSK
jgi:hypothetical protein